MGVFVGVMDVVTVNEGDVVGVCVSTNVAVTVGVTVAVGVVVGVGLN